MSSNSYVKNRGNAELHTVIYTTTAHMPLFVMNVFSAAAELQWGLSFTREQRKVYKTKAVPIIFHRFWLSFYENVKLCKGLQFELPEIFTAFNITECFKSLWMDSSILIEKVLLLSGSVIFVMYHKSCYTLSFLHICFRLVWPPLTFVI